MLDDYKSKKVNSIILYEVKSKIQERTRPVDISKKSYARFIELEYAGFQIKMVYMRLLSDWKFTYKIYEYSEFKNIQLRKNRFLFGLDKNKYPNF